MPRSLKFLGMSQSRGPRGHMYDLVLPHARHECLGTLHMFELSSADLLSMADTIVRLASQGLRMSIHLGGQKLDLSHGSETGRGLAREDGTLEVCTNRVDLFCLAKELQQIALDDREEVIGVSHFHMEPVYMATGAGVDDIVFQRLEPGDE
jgi:hypothetical protein